MKLLLQSKEKYFLIDSDFLTPFNFCYNRLAFMTNIVKSCFVLVGMVSIPYTIFKYKTKWNKFHIVQRSRVILDFSFKSRLRYFMFTLFVLFQIKI